MEGAEVGRECLRGGGGLLAALVQLVEGAEELNVGSVEGLIVAGEGRLEGGS